MAIDDSIAPPALPFEILHEDDSILFVNKSSGIVVQRGYDPDEPVLFDQVAAYLEEKGEIAFLLQRLDRGTSGVMFFSKNQKANAKLTRQFERKLIRKRYLALCEGVIASPQTIDAPLDRIGPISFGVRGSGRRAITRITPIAASAQATLLSVELLTGRTHQIRVHLAAIGHPLAGDWLYGERNAARPMLHALRIEMLHPRTGEPLSIEAPPPADFLKEMTARRMNPAAIWSRPSVAEDRVSPNEVDHDL